MFAPLCAPSSLSNIPDEWWLAGQPNGQEKGVIDRAVQRMLMVNRTLNTGFLCQVGTLVDDD